MPRTIEQIPSKPCKHCGKSMTRKRYTSGRMEAVAPFMRRKYCDRRCRSSRGKQIPPKPCKHCGKRMTRKRYTSGRMEAAGDFRRRKYCDQGCKCHWGQGI